MAADAAHIGGFVMLFPKLIETQYYFASSTAAMATGALILPGSIIGISMGTFSKIIYH